MQGCAAVWEDTTGKDCSSREGCCSVLLLSPQLCLIRNSLVKEKVKSTGDSKLVGIFELGSELKNRTKKLLQVGLSKFMKLIKI